MNTIDTEYEKEIWKPLEIYNGEYAVSNFGRVMSLKHGKKRILKPSKSNGYPSVNISFEKKSRTKKVHNLVAIGFEIMQDGLQVNHIDGNKCNNNLKNLEICTGSHNLKHSYKIGLRSQKDVINPAAKINMEIANKIRKEVFGGKTQTFVSRKYKISKSQVSYIINNKSWTVD